MKLPEKWQRIVQRLQQVPKKYYLFSLFVLGALLYGVTFFVPKPVQFSYADGACTPQLTVLPDFHQQVGGERYVATFQDRWVVGNVTLASLKTCFSPQATPEAGRVAVATAPFGGIIARKHFSLAIPQAPVAQVAIFDNPLPVSRPLEIPLSEPDKTFSYHLANGDTSAECEVADAILHCNVPELKLGQGKRYTLELNRTFKDNSSTLASEKVVTLKAVKIKKSSVKAGQTIYAKPRTFTFKTDKPLTAAETTLTLRGEQPRTIKTTTKVKGKTITVRTAEPLARQTDYRLTLKQAEAEDGSTLVEPESYGFTMSGGPKVTNVSVGRSRVGVSQVITAQFDQALGKNAASFIGVSGGKAAVTASGKTATVALQSLPKCQPFTLKVKKGLPSKYGITTTDDWQFKSRTVCHTTSVYGTSLQGRPLVAYHFGSRGPTTMYVGALHGNEPSSSSVLQAWINELEAHPEKFKDRRIVVVPTINPDGVAAGTRANSRGVNLNRNFPTSNWQRDIDDTDGKHKNGGGKEPLSEPEAKALAALTQQVSPRLLLSFHAIGGLVQGDPGSPSAAAAARYAGLVGYANATGQGDTFDYGITGGYEQWAWENNGIPALVVELGSYGYADINQHRAALWAMLE